MNTSNFGGYRLMSPFQAIRSVYGNYANFRGRATRSEFWWFVLFYIVSAYALILLATAAGGDFAVIGLLVYGLFFVGSIVPYLAVAVRRLHDAGKSGWWMLIAPIPFGGLLLLIFWASPTAGALSGGPLCGQCGKNLSPYWRDTCGHCKATYAEFPPVTA